MVYIKEVGENSVYFPKTSNTNEKDFALLLHSELTQKDFEFEVTDISTKSNFYLFVFDSTDIDRGEYEYSILDSGITQDIGLIRIGNVTASAGQIYALGNCYEVIEYYPYNNGGVLQDKDFAATENGDYLIQPDGAYYGLRQVNLTVDVDVDAWYQSGVTDGVTDQKNKLVSTAFTENGTYTRDNGWSAVTVDVPEPEVQTIMEDLRNDAFRLLTPESSEALNHHYTLARWQWYHPTSSYTGGVNLTQDIKIDVNDFIESGYTSGYTQGYNSGFTTGYTSGKTDGVAEQKAKLTGLYITSNGNYTRNDGYSAVTVNVPTGSTINNQNKSLNIVNNGTSSVTFDVGYTGLGTVGINVNVPTGHTDEEMAQAFNSGYTSGSEEGYDSGFTTGYTSGYTDGEISGIDYQKSLLTNTAFTLNGTYTRPNGYSAVTVNVAQTGHTDQEIIDAFNSGYTTGYTSGYTDGEISGITHQKSLLSSSAFTANGTYTRNDGWSAVTVNVPTPVRKYVQDLINEGYATVVTGSGGNYIMISSACPYQQSDIVDLAMVATNNKKISTGINNTIIWNDVLPSGWDVDEIYNELYHNCTISTTPRAQQFWSLTGLSAVTITYIGGSYQVNDYPWGSGGSNNGIFAPRWNSDPAIEAEYVRKGFRNTPKDVTVNFTGDYGSIAQTMFAEMNETTAITINCQWFSVVDWTGMFEDCYKLQTLTINGLWRYDFTRLCHNMFRHCGMLVSIPYVVDWGRDHAQNTIYPHYDGWSISSSDGSGMFEGCNSLTSIGPTINMNAISLSGCTVDGVNQSPLSYSMFYCPNATDVRLKNVGNNSWNFTDTSTYTYLPKLDVASIEYILNNVKDENGNGYTLTFSTLHQGEISSSALTNATSKGWTITYA